MLLPYRKIYTSDILPLQTALHVCLNNLSISCITEQAAEAPITPFKVAGLLKTIELLQSFKACEEDGNHVELLKTFSSQLRNRLLLSYSHILVGCYIPSSFKNGSEVNFLKPAKNPENAKCYNPITLLNTDYKTFAKHLADRLNKSTQ